MKISNIIIILSSMSQTSAMSEPWDMNIETAPIDRAFGDDESMATLQQYVNDIGLLKPHPELYNACLQRRIDEADVEAERKQRETIDLTMEDDEDEDEDEDEGTYSNPIIVD